MDVSAMNRTAVCYHTATFICVCACVCARVFVCYDVRAFRSSMISMFKIIFTG